VLLYLFFSIINPNVFQKIVIYFRYWLFHCLEKCLWLSRTYCLEGAFFPLTALVIKPLVVFGLQVGCFVSTQMLLYHHLPWKVPMTSYYLDTFTILSIDS
jgi:hypothetical protein